MKPLTATERNVVAVLLGGKVTNHASISALAEKGLVRCGDTLTPIGKEAAYAVLFDRLPDRTRTLGAELLKAAAYARNGMPAPNDDSLFSWQDEPVGEGWYWVEGLPNGQHMVYEGPLYIKDARLSFDQETARQFNDRWAIVVPAAVRFHPLAGRRVCLIVGRPQ